MAYAWALDRSVTMSGTAKRRLRRLDGEIARYGEEWSLAEMAAAAKDTASKDRRLLPQPTSSVAASALRRSRRRGVRRAADGNPCRDVSTFRNPKPDDDDSDAESGNDDGGGAAGQPGMTYEVTITYRTMG
jgi:hypothetical protein